MSLTETRDELIDAIQSNLSALLVPVSIQAVAAELEEVAGWFQSLGICNLLLYAEPDRLYENLVRSGHTRRYFLSRSLTEGKSGDYQLAISRWDSFLDVVAAGHFTLARELATLSTTAWVPAGEYEDDFLYRHFLQQFIAPPAPEQAARLRATLDRWRAWLDGPPPPRLDCCEALLAREAAAFAAAFEDLIEARQAEIAKQQKMALAADLNFAPRSAIHVEGLALLRIAQALGFALEPDYPLCPGLARLPAVKPWPADLYPLLEAERDPYP